MNDEKKDFLPYLAIKKELYQCFLVSRGDYYREKVKHNDWPPNPEIFYKEEWECWEEFLGLNRKVFFTPYRLLAPQVRQLGIKSIPQYVAECKKNSNWPFNPENAFAVEWEGWYKFFGIESEEHSDAEKKEEIFTSTKSASS